MCSNIINIHTIERQKCEISVSGANESMPTAKNAQYKN